MLRNQESVRKRIAKTFLRNDRDDYIFLKNDNHQQKSVRHYIYYHHYRCFEYRSKQLEVCCRAVCLVFEPKEYPSGRMFQSCFA